MNAIIYNRHIKNIKLEHTRDAQWVNIELQDTCYCDIWLTEDQARQLRDVCEELYPAIKQPEPPAQESAEAVLEALADREAASYLC